MKKNLIGWLILFFACCAALFGVSCGSDVLVSGIELSDYSVELYVGENYQLEYTIFPEKATNSNVNFYSSDESIVSVKSDGFVCALSQGSAYVTVITEDGQFEDVCYITVIDKEAEVQTPDDSQSGDEQTENKDEDDEQGGEQETQGDTGENDNDPKEDDEGDTPQIITYVVTFVSDGEIVATREFTGENLSVEEPAVPEKTGYSGEWESYSLALEDITVTAIYTPIIYTATFVAIDDIFEINFTIEDDAIAEPEVPSRTGYTGKWESYSLALENITVNAVYTPIQYTATFMVNGISYEVEFTIEDEAINEPEIPPMAGYGGKWESYSIVCEDITVNAVYTLIEYTITYENIKTAENPNTDSYTVINTVVLVDLALEGYKFEGWYLDGEKITSLNNLYGNLTLTALWSLIEYEIRFYDENANVEIGRSYYTVENTQIEFPLIPEKDGYEGSWSYFELNYDEEEPVYVHIVYTKIE